MTSARRYPLHVRSVRPRRSAGGLLRALVAGTVVTAVACLGLTGVILGVGRYVGGSVAARVDARPALSLAAAASPAPVIDRGAQRAIIAALNLPEPRMRPPVQVAAAPPSAPQ